MSSRAQDDDRVGRVVDDLVADRAQQQPGKPAAAACADDDELDVLGRFEDRCCRCAAAQDALDGLVEAGGVEAFNGGVEEMPSAVRECSRVDRYEVPTEGDVPGMDDRQG